MGTTPGRATRPIGLSYASVRRQQPPLQTRLRAASPCGAAACSWPWWPLKRTRGVTFWCPPKMLLSPTTRSQRPLQRTHSRAPGSQSQRPVRPAGETDTGRAASGPAVPCRAEASHTSGPGPPSLRSCAPLVHHPSGPQLRRDPHATHAPTLDTESGPSIIRVDALPKVREEHLHRRPQLPHMVHAKKNPIVARGMITLCLQRGRLPTDVDFGVLHQLALSVLPSTSFINRQVEALTRIADASADLRTRRGPFCPEQRVARGDAEERRGTPPCAFCSGASCPRIQAPPCRSLTTFPARSWSRRTTVSTRRSTAKRHAISRSSFRGNAIAMRSQNLAPAPSAFERGSWSPPSPRRTSSPAYS